MNNKRMQKIMLNYRPDGRKRFGIHLTRLLDEADTGLSRSNSSWMMMMMMMNDPFNVPYYTESNDCSTCLQKSGMYVEGMG